LLKNRRKGKRYFINCKIFFVKFLLKRSISVKKNQKNMLFQPKKRLKSKKIIVLTIRKIRIDVTKNQKKCFVALKKVYTFAAEFLKT
jgi:hypothetical protein